MVAWAIYEGGHDRSWGGCGQSANSGGRWDCGIEDWVWSVRGLVDLGSTVLVLVLCAWSGSGADQTKWVD